MYCKKCGAKLHDGAKFCKECGWKLPEHGTPTANTNPESGLQQPGNQINTNPKPGLQQPGNHTNQNPGQNSSTRLGEAYQQPQPASAPPKKSSGISGKAIAMIVGVLILVGAIIVGVAYYATNASGKKKTAKDGDEVTEEIEPKEQATRTLMIYIVGSNLESGGGYSAYGGAASRDIDEMLMADLPADTNVVLQCGGATEWQNEKIPDNTVSRFSVEKGKLTELENLGKVPMTRTGSLTDFITFAKENFPADNYTLILWDHGGGIPVGFGSDELGDEMDMMTSYEIKDEIEKADIDFDAVIFDACNMCTLEMGMALKDHAKYMVGAESYVNNAGIYYTNWLGELDGDPSSFCETIVKDYMDAIDGYGQVGSMSVVRLDYIQDVYDAYVDYIQDVSDDVDSGYYADFAKARSNCGAFEDIDSVDLIALATAYDTDSAADLINKAVNAVSYTDSDFPYGHGIVVYCPYDWYEYYDDGRQAFVELGYDETVTGFYDRFISQELAYLGDDYVEDYGGDWYTGDYTSAVISAGGNADVYDLDVIETDYYYAVELTDADWESISYICQTLSIETDDGENIVLGQDLSAQVDSYGRLAMVDPESWTFINDNIAAFYCVDYYEDPDTGEWAEMGYIPITVNGNGAHMYVYYDDDYPEGTIQGYYTFDFDTEEEGDILYTFEDDDEIDLAYKVWSDSEDSSGDYYTQLGESILYSDLELGFYDIDLNDYVTKGYYSIYDVYGSLYMTPIEYLGSNDNLL